MTNEEIGRAWGTAERKSPRGNGSFTWYVDEPNTILSFSETHYLPLSISEKIKELKPVFKRSNAFVFDGEAEAFDAVGEALVEIRKHL